MLATTSAPLYACKCLNVQIRSQAPPDTSPPRTLSVLDDSYESVYVGEEGIHVSHTYLTIRTRQYSHFPDRPSTRHILLKCLICSVTIYGVCRELSKSEEVDSREGPLIQNEDWVLKSEVLKSKDGWVEVNVQESLGTPDASDRIKYDALFSSNFSILVPPLPQSSSTSASPPPSSHAPSYPTVHLPPLPSPIHPATYAISHPVFLSLAKDAETFSAELRSKAQRDLDEWVRNKVAEIEAEERKLRREVDAIWSRWKTSWAQTQQVSPTSPIRDPMNGERRNTRRRDSSPSSGPRVNPAIMSVREFKVAESPIPARRESTESLRPRVVSSSLSTSLAAASGQHFRYNSPTPPPVTTSPTISPPSDQATMQLFGPYNRSKDESLAIQVSLKAYAHRMEDVVKKKSRKRSRERSERGRAGLPEDARVTAQAVVETESEGAMEHIPEEAGPVPLEDREGEKRPPGPRKRVTFDETHEETESEAEEEDVSVDPHGPEPEVFDLDQDSPDAPLPPTQHSSQTPSTSSNPASSDAVSSSSSALPTSSEDAHPQPTVETALLKLVAAHTPSHRTLWKEEGKVWEIFGKGSTPGSATATLAPDGSWDSDELGDGSDWKNPSEYAISLPIKMERLVPISQRRGPVVATPDSWQAKTSLADRTGILVPPLLMPSTKNTNRARSTSITAREKVYAERDLTQSIDPGPMFEALSTPPPHDEVDGEERDEVDELNGTSGRKLALKILQKQDQIPDEGMWRSLA